MSGRSGARDTRDGAKEAAAPPRSGVLKAPAYELFLLLLSLLSAGNSLVVVLAFLVSRVGPAAEVVLMIDVALVPVFLFDFLYRLAGARPPRRYLVREGGWADLIAVVPVLRVFRLVRCSSVIRLLELEGRSRILGELSATRARSTFLATIFLVVVVVEFASAAVYYAENGKPGSNIATAGDAIWFALVTITTVGYGDYYPVTFWGRIAGVFLLFAGVGLFSVLTGFIANTFLAPRARPRLAPAPGDPRAAIVAVRGLVDEQDERNVAIRHRLDELERLVADARAGQDGGRPPGDRDDESGPGTVTRNVRHRPLGRQPVGGEAVERRTAAGAADRDDAG